MDINETLELNAYVDGELGLERQLEIEARLRGDAALRARVDALRRVREEVRGQAQYHAAPPGCLPALTPSLCYTLRWPTGFASVSPLTAP